MVFSLLSVFQDILFGFLKGSDIILYNVMFPRDTLKLLLSVTVPFYERIGLKFAQYLEVQSVLHCKLTVWLGIILGCAPVWEPLVGAAEGLFFCNILFSTYLLAFLK